MFVQIRLAGTSEIAALLGVSRVQVHRLSKRPDFPEPVAELDAGRIWLLDDIEAWQREHADRRPGRPEKPRP